ncbi:isoquinoline 1-oxidoreductase, alpha subunit [Enhydrobacter aerosaccus]|uniref:Isoquinoline 1-oxidoreductase, alpha subunit n=1 Tax=Enhydrobacter aerosaccus TaxID=225324 RepID=A0A1T4RHD2_9HYPH|nr:(2Fe-2S)-binding protein [Enhydrobacter aerosaccus]SKA15148.1 isoquinoline 1-oxidoreductase, alpha subunit [Enhydrobacter aerosaccus]
MIALVVNGTRHDVDVPADKPLLWVLREDLNIVGPKFGCGVAACGACTVHVDGQAVRSCSLPVGEAAGKAVTTIEGLGNGRLHAVQRAWIEEQVPQCGYCQPGFIMATAALLRDKPRPTDADIDEALTNICRCGTYSAVRRAVHRAAAIIGGAS